MQTFVKEPLHIDDVVVYLRTTITSGRFKFVGRVLSFEQDKVKVRQLSRADEYVIPAAFADYGEHYISLCDIICLV